jgi:hypothetical protein
MRASTCELFNQSRAVVFEKYQQFRNFIFSKRASCRCGIDVTIAKSDLRPMVAHDLCYTLCVSREVRLVRHIAGFFDNQIRNRRSAMAFVPKPYVVYVTSVPTKKNGLKETYTSRVGPATSVDDARRLIAKNKRDLGETYGSMIEAPDQSGNTYQIFKANWEDVTVTA